MSSYKVVPFIGRSRGTLSASDVAQQLESTINDYASSGWELVQLSDINIEVQPGCLAGLFGAKISYARFDQLIFRSDEPAVLPSTGTVREPTANAVENAPESSKPRSWLREIWEPPK